MAAPEGLVDDVEPLQKKQKVPLLLEPRAAAASSANRNQLPENEVMEIPKWLRRQLSWSDSSDEGEFDDNVTVGDDRPGKSGVNMTTARFRARPDRMVEECCFVAVICT